jgi:hypothetical protein
MRISRLALLACAAGANAQIYVSPAGDEANPGTRAQQVRTLAHARDLARARKTTEVILTCGVYRLSEPLRLGPEDSGVTYSAMKSGPAAVVSGGQRITGWKRVDSQRNLWSAPAPVELANTRQLYIDGIRATRTRGRLPVELTKTDTGYVASGDAMSKWRNASEIEFVFTGGNAIWSEPSAGLGSWTEPRCPVAAIDGNGITMAQPCWDNSTKRVMYADPAFNRTANLVGRQAWASNRSMWRTPMSCWVRPDNGTSTLGYAVTVNPGGRKAIFTGRGEIGLDGTHTTFGVIDDLRPGEIYTFAVAAITPLGDGPAMVTAPVAAQ